MKVSMATYVVEKQTDYIFEDKRDDIRIVSFILQ